MKTEREKMLAGELYNPADPELSRGRRRCRKIVHQLNNTMTGTSEWRSAIDELIPNANDACLEPPFHCDYGTNIKLGKHFYSNYNCVILDVAEVKIGDNVMFAPNVQLYTATHPVDIQRRINEGVEYGLPITIGDNVWLGGGVVVCPGVSIGEGAVIGAGSVVTKDIPANVVAVGNPCRVIRTIDNTGAQS